MTGFHSVLTSVIKDYIPYVILLSLVACGTDPVATKTYNEREWWHYQGDPSRNQYSPLDQVNTENVNQLQVAWTYRSGDQSPAGRSQIQCNPLIIKGVLYGTTPRLNCIALKADTGEEIWRFDPFPERDPNLSLSVNRGLMYWEDESHQRIFYTALNFLHCLDAKTGRLVDSFGDNGRLDIKKALGPDAQQHHVTMTSPGVIFQDKIILGSSVSEAQLSAPGYIVAYNLHSGEVEWIFHTIPHPGEYGYWTWPEDSWQKTGGANNWAGMSLDEERGILYVPTGSASFDFYGGNRHGRNLFANCIIALNAETGERFWHYQTVHHDLWDRDLPAPPNLVTLKHKGKDVLALAQISKGGFVFVFNRVTGESLFPINEIEVPGSDLRGEEAWSTQPIPQKPDPFSRQFISEEEFNDFDPEVKKKALERYKTIRQGEYFIPMSVEGTLIFPGFDGGGEWGGAAVDPEEGIMYINSNEMPWIHEMVDLIPGSEANMASAGKLLYQQHCAICHKPDMKGDGRVYPDITERRSNYSRQELKSYISTGRGIMPAFDFLSDKQKSDLVTYVLNPDAETGEIADLNDVDDLVKEIPYSHTGYNRWVDPDGNPVITPPWGQLHALDLNTGEYLWQVPLGELDYLTEKGIPPTGTENYGGPVITAGDLLFIGATKDEKFRAFNRRTGKILWETKLPYGGYATPSVYEVDGKQYIVIACGGGKMGTQSGDTYMAFSLP